MKPSKHLTIVIKIGAYDAFPQHEKKHQTYGCHRDVLDRRRDHTRAHSLDTVLDRRDRDQTEARWA